MYVSTPLFFPIGGGGGQGVRTRRGRDRSMRAGDWGAVAPHDRRSGWDGGGIRIVAADSTDCENKILEIRRIGEGTNAAARHAHRRLASTDCARLLLCSMTSAPCSMTSAPLRPHTPRRLPFALCSAIYLSVGGPEPSARRCISLQRQPADRVDRARRPAIDAPRRAAE